MKTEQNLTNFNSRVQHLRAVTGRSQAAIAATLEVSRTTLHYYCTGQNEPKPSVWFRLEQAERRAGDAGAGGASSAAGRAGDRPPPEEPALVADERPRTESELTRHLRWLHGAQARQEKVALAAQQHLEEIAGWVRDTEAELTRVRKGTGRGGALRRTPTGSEEERAPLRDIDTVSLPIFGALPAGRPQAREGVAGRRPVRSVAVPRGRFPEGAFGLEVRGDSMNAARPVPILDRDIVVLLSPELRAPQHDDIVAALIDGETCLKRLKLRKSKKHTFLQSESTNPAHGALHPTHDLVIQGVFVGKL